MRPNLSPVTGLPRAAVAVRWGFACVLLLAVGRVVAAEASAGGASVLDSTTTEIDWTQLSFGLMGGLALLLFGLEELSGSLRKIAGARMKDVMSRLTTNRFAGVLTGFFVTGIIQSSSVTTVLAVGFISAQLMTLAQAIGVILGAKIGTTITGQIIAFKITKYALLFVAGGFAVSFIWREGKVHRYGRLVFGIGMVFFGMAVMSDAMQPLRNYAPFIESMAHMERWSLAILLGAVFTGVVQSSSATMGVVIALASQGLIPLESGIALALGANIGTCVTAGLAALGKPREAVRAAVAHILLSVSAAALMLLFIPHIAEFARWISPVAPEGLDRAEALAAAAPRQIANAHTAMSIATVILFLPFITPIAALLQRIIPDAHPTPAEAEREEYAARYLDRALLNTPEMAIEMVRREVERMARNVGRMFKAVDPLIFQGDNSQAEEIHTLKAKVDSLNRQAIDYLSSIGMEGMTGAAADQSVAAMTVATELESIADIIDRNLVGVAHARQRHGLELDAEFVRSVRRYHQLIDWTLACVSRAFVEQDREEARIIMEMKSEIQMMDARIRQRHEELIRQGAARGNVRPIVAQTDIMESFKRIYYHIKRIAKVAAHEEDAANWLGEGNSTSDNQEEAK